MTATVTIKTYLDDQKQLKVNIKNDTTGEKLEEFVLIDGQSAERHVFHGISITALEEDKPKPLTPEQPAA